MSSFFCHVLKHAIDDCCYYVFTMIQGPLKARNERIAFLEEEEISTIQADEFLSEDASCQLYQLFDSNK